VLESAAVFERFRRALFGNPRDLKDPHVFSHIALVPFLAWIGLGSDGLSSSAYGPDEAFRSLGTHSYLVFYLALATAATVFIISYAYSRIIEHFPTGGGGYVVASKLLGHRAGVISGCALLVDYVLTISVSIASGSDAVFSFLPHAWLENKLTVDVVVILFLIVLNLRGIRESVTSLMPIFVAFLVLHAVFLAIGIGGHLGDVGTVTTEVSQGTSHDLHTLGLFGLLMLLFRAYSMGGGTYTGIEAVSNGIGVMREPRVVNAKRTMVYLASSLAVTAGGILLVYLLTHVRPVEGQTMNAVALDAIFGNFRMGNLAVGHWMVVATLVSEGALLFVAAQTGFIDGPRVMSNMAIDSWFPHSFASLSERLTMRNGVLLIGLFSLGLVLYTHGNVDALVVMYSINVFITFSMSQLGMLRFWIRNRETRVTWRREVAVHLVGFVLCAGILIITMIEKFTEGGWLTLLITGLLVGLCFLIRADYRRAARGLYRLNQILSELPLDEPEQPKKIDPHKPTAVLVVQDYGGLGIHTLLNIQRAFPNYFHNFVFVNLGLVDSSSFKGSDEVGRLDDKTKTVIDKYVSLARRLGLAADGRTAVGTDPVADVSNLAIQTARGFSNVVAFSGWLIFEDERWYDRILHNRTAFAIQRRVQFAGIPMVILPARIMARDFQTPGVVPEPAL
jgi:amino acid transporter